MRSIAHPAAPSFPGSVVYLQPPPAAATSQVDGYRHNLSVGLGATQLVLGCLCIVFNCVSLGLNVLYYGLGIAFVGHGIWCGVLFIIAGAFGISAGMSKTKCKIITYMVLSIISACFTSALLACGIIGAVGSGSRVADGRCDYGYSYYYDYYYRPPCNEYKLDAAMEGCIAVCGLIAAILFIWASTLACMAKVCTCCQSQPSIVPIHSGPTTFQGLQVTAYPLTTMPYQQGMVVVTTPPPYQPNAVPMVNTATASAVATDASRVQYDNLQRNK